MDIGAMSDTEIQSLAKQKLLGGNGEQLYETEGCSTKTLSTPMHASEVTFFFPKHSGNCDSMNSVQY